VFYFYKKINHKQDCMADPELFELFFECIEDSLQLAPNTIKSKALYLRHFVQILRNQPSFTAWGDKLKASSGVLKR
jgi:hypothetical protein